MAQSLSRVLIHAIFSTKNRVQQIDDAVEDRLFAYLSVVLNNAKCPSIRVGGHRDHVHLFFGLHRTLAIAEIIEMVKTSSSRWMKEQGYMDFYWQSGYGAFSVSQSDTDSVVKYVLGQKKRHQQMSFQDEFRLFLVKHEVEYDERYVWD